MLGKHGVCAYAYCLLSLLNMPELLCRCPAQNLYVIRHDQ
jgi:hypothetical protein